MGLRRFPRHPDGNGIVRGTCSDCAGRRHPSVTARPGRRRPAASRLPSSTTGRRHVGARVDAGAQWLRAGRQWSGVREHHARHRL